MKPELKLSILALIALLCASVMSGFAGLASKVVLRELPSLTVLFFRINVMILVMLPFVWKTLPELAKRWRTLLLLGLLWSGNVGLFIVAIKMTTVIASSLLYALVPVVMLVLQQALLKTRIRKYQIFGVSIGLMGAITMLVGSWTGDMGELLGNVLLSIAVVCWSTYLLLSKKFNAHISAAGLTFGSAVGAWFVIGALMLLTEGLTGLSVLPQLSGGGWVALWYIALAVGVGMIFLNQWGLKYAPPLSSGMMQYTGMIVGSVSGIVFLGEKVTLGLLVGGLLMIVGVFIVATVPIFISARQKYRSQSV